MTRSLSWAIRVTGVIALAGIATLTWMALVVAPPDAVQGDAQRLMYVHVPAAWLAYLAYFVTAAASGLYLIPRTRSLRWDALAGASAEIGVVFTALTIVAGSLWARPVWGIWWTWDARLTSALVCWLLYAGYLMLRHAIEEPTQRATVAAVFNIFAFVDVPIVIFSIKWFRTQHPQPVMWGGGSIDPDYSNTLMLNWLALGLLAIVLTMIRLRQEETQREIDSLRRYAHAM